MSKKEPKLLTIETAWHTVEIPENEMEKVIAFCNDNNITTDYYMWEFMTWEDEES